MSPQHLLFMLAITLVWGMNFVIAKIGVGVFPPLMFTALRFVLVAALLVPFLRITKGQMGRVLAVAVTAGSLHFALMFTGVSITDASVAALVVQLNVPFATFLSILFLGEIVGWKRWTGIGLAFAGIAIISFDPRVFSHLDGVLLLVMGAFSMAVAMIIMRQMKDVGSMQLQAWIAWTSAPVLLLLSFVVEADQVAVAMNAPLWAWGAIAYSAIAASIFGHAGMYYLVQRYEVSLVGPLTLMAPVFGVFFAVTLLGEGLTSRIIMGGIVTLAGVAFVASRQASAVGEEIEQI